MKMRLYIPVEPVRPAARCNFLNLPQLREKREIAVNSPEADIRKFVLHAQIYRLCCRMILTVHKASLNCFPLATFLNHSILQNNNRNCYWNQYNLIFLFCQAFFYFIQNNSIFFPRYINIVIIQREKRLC